MKKSRKCFLALLLGLYVAQSEGKELLGGISDDTAPPVAQPEPSAMDNDRRIIYRVICSPEGEQLPECAQPPVSDSFAAEQSKQAETKNPERHAITETLDQPPEQTVQEDQPGEVAEPMVPKKASGHKKRSKKSTSSHAKKTAKPAKKRKRH